MPTINYNLNIPFASNSPSQDQPKMLTNTNAINTWAGVDHFNFSNNNAGYHAQVSLANESAPGVPAGLGGVLFANTASGQSWPFWQNGAGTTQLLGNANSLSANGYAKIPIGANTYLIFQWGVVNSPGSGSSTVNFPLSFPNAVFSVQLTPRNDGSHSAFTYYLDGAPVAASFKYRGTTSGSNSLFWFAVGN